MMEEKALQKREDPIYTMLAKYKTAIASVLPKHLTVEKMLRVAYQVINRTPKLRQCTPLSLINGLIEISMDGLSIGRTAHLVPFGKEATVIIDYKGFIDLAHRSGQINSFPFKPVYENDAFDYEEGTTRYIKHKPATHDRGKLVAAYAIVNFKHGGFDFEVVHPVDIQATKKMSSGAKFPDSPWNNPDMEWTMWCKTAVRRLAKRIPQSPELTRALELEDMAEVGLSQNIAHVTDEIIDVESTSDLTEKIKNIPAKEESQTQEKELDFTCEICGYQCKSEQGLKKHMTMSHKKAPQKPSAPPESTKTSSEGQRPSEQGMINQGREQLGLEPREEMNNDIFCKKFAEYLDILGEERCNEELDNWGYMSKSPKAVTSVPDMRAILKVLKANVDKQNA